MNFTDYTVEQLRAILALVMKNQDKLPMSATLQGAKKVYAYLLFPDLDPTKAIVLSSFKGRSAIINPGKSYLSRGEKDFVRNLEIKLDKWKAPISIANLQMRGSWDKPTCERLCTQLWASAPAAVEALLKGVDLGKIIEAEKKQKEQAKKYAEKRGATTFSYTEQRTIASQILRFVEKEYITPMVSSMFKDPEKIRMNTTYSIPTETYYAKMLTGWAMSPRTIDPSGQQLYDSLPEVFNLDPEEILQKLVLAGGHYGADARRFALKFSDKYNVSGLIDSDPEVRLLAKEKVGKK